MSNIQKHDKMLIVIQLDNGGIRFQNYEGWSVDELEQVKAGLESLMGYLGFQKMMENMHESNSET
jgi:hypothetical protein